MKTKAANAKSANLASTGHGIRIFSVVPSLDTPLWDAQTKRFNEEAAKMPELSIYTFRRLRRSAGAAPTVWTA